MDIKSAIAQVIEGQSLSAEQMTAVMQAIMSGGATPAQIAAFLVAMRLKGETVIELTAAAQVMRSLASGVELSGLEHTVDIVGTGGDQSGSFNISTTAMFVAAAAGCHVAKHGNRAVSSRSGSADVLEAAGIRLDLNTEQVAQCVREVGVGFMFAPMHHSAMKHAITPRREIGVRTLFNLLGPLTNPAQVPHQVLGVFAQHWVEPLAQVLQQLGVQHALVVHAEDGLDEISLSAPTTVAELKAGDITTYSIRPEDFGIRSAPLDAIQVDGPDASLARMREVLAGQRGPAADIVALNAGAAIYVAGIKHTLAEGIGHAQTLIASGAAAERLAALIQLTQAL